MTSESRSGGMARRVFLAVVAGLVAAPGAGGQGFVPGFEDLPLMPGLSPLADAGLSFDSAAGRVVQAYAEGRVGRREVLAFYAASLPALGWRQLADARFAREGEALTLEFQAEAGRLLVRFLLSPL